MTKDKLVQAAHDFISNDFSNQISKDIALSPDLTDVKMYDLPLIKIGDANDPYFEKVKERIGQHFMTPHEWLPNADSIISIFLPASSKIRTDNYIDNDWPSSSWLHARIEGQMMIAKLSQFLKSLLEKEGYQAVIPTLDPRFFAREGLPEATEELQFTSNWSERHVAFICGLGTFGLSKGLISEKGVAGRYTSLITNLSLPKDKREYQDLYEYCSMCGICARNCPAKAISIENGKDHIKCSAYLNLTRERFSPRYGCGKCQIKVPCETKSCKRV